MWHKDRELQLHYLLLVVLLLSACSSHKVHIPKESILEKTVQINKIKSLSEVSSIPQNPSFYTHNIEEKKFSSELFYKKHFRVWNIHTPSEKVENMMWGHRSYNHKNSYGENLQPIHEEFFKEMLHNANFSQFASLNKKALSLDLLNMRVFPTNKPLFKDPKIAGEGFPFDYLQNSTVAANKPLLVSHYSKDRQWVFVESSFAFGWVESKDIAFVAQKDVELLQNKEQVFITKEGVPIYSQNGDFLFHSKVGMLFAFMSEDKESYTVLTPSRTNNGAALFLNSKILKKDATKGALSFNKENIEKILGEISASKYGWGGMYGERDCSSTLRDFYTPFALWLPRNSYTQAQQGQKISLDGLSTDEKQKIIKEQGIPFETLLYKKGHIVLYVGNYNDAIVVFQNVWGIKTKKDEVEGRFIIGRSIFSTLELGKELEEFDTESSLLKNLKSMNVLTKAKL